MHICFAGSQASFYENIGKTVTALIKVLFDMIQWRQDRLINALEYFQRLMCIAFA